MSLFTSEPASGPKGDPEHWAVPPGHGHYDDPQYRHRGVVYVSAGTGQTRWISNDVYTLKVGENETNGALALCEATVPPGAGAVLPHVHNANDEAFYLLHGELEFLNGDQAVQAKAGDFLFVPRGVRHAFANRGVHAAKMIFMFTPADLGNSVIEVGQEARPGEAPDPTKPPDHMIDLDYLLRRYSTKILTDS
jgi:mannose-6-phosphate isomerase-like protein (cupin superfamily)